MGIESRRLIHYDPRAWPGGVDGVWRVRRSLSGQIPDARAVVNVSMRDSSRTVCLVILPEVPALALQVLQSRVRCSHRGSVSKVRQLHLSILSNVNTVNAYVAERSVRLCPFQNRGSAAGQAGFGRPASA